MQDTTAWGRAGVRGNQSTSSDNPALEQTKNFRIVDARHIYSTDAEGRFEILALPGHGIVTSGQSTSQTIPEAPVASPSQEKTPGLKCPSRFPPPPHYVTARQPFQPDTDQLGSEAVPVALRGRRANPAAFENESDLALVGAVPEVAGASAAEDDISAFVERIVDNSFRAAKQFAESKEAAKQTGTYPETKLARKLKLMSRLIKLGGGTRIFYASQSGYDKHSAQLENPSPAAQRIRRRSGSVSH